MPRRKFPKFLDEKDLHPQVIVEIASDLLKAMVTQGFHGEGDILHLVDCIHGLPPTARLVRTYISHPAETVCLVLEDESFNPTDDPPTFQVQFTSTDVKPPV